MLRVLYPYLIEGVVALASVREHLKSAKEFYEAGVKHYKEGRRFENLMLMRGLREGFHAYAECLRAQIG